MTTNKRIREKVCDDISKSEFLTKLVIEENSMMWMKIKKVDDIPSSKIRKKNRTNSLLSRTQTDERDIVS
jgi:hypothetical protein